VVATVSTRWVAITISVVAFLAFNYFFLPPLRTWTVADPQNWVALFSLLAVSVVASHLSSQVRRRAQDATARRDEVARLFDLTCDILLTTDTADAVADIARHIARRFALERVTICLPQAQGWKLCASDAGNPDVHTAWLESALARRPARASAEPQGQRYSGHQRLDLANGRHAWLVPLRTVTRPIGFLALEDEDIDPGTRDAIAGVAAIAIERTHLLEDRKEAEVVRRGSELKSALLASLGHDLKTPLTAASVAANNLDASWLTDAQRREQIEIVRTELGRLNRLFQDILDMARIDTHAVAAEVEWVQPEEIVEAAAAQVQHSLETHRLEIAVDSNRIFVRVDPRLTSAALAHVLENAAQYSPPGSSIVVTAGLSSGELHLSVRDHGAGIAPGDADHLFERFYRGGEARRRRFGTGMGLAITRGLLAAEGGRISAANHPDGGAVFTIAVPTESRTADAVEVEAL
jgi:two-component system sensor histidine kinase KdpD